MAEAGGGGVRGGCRIRRRLLVLKKMLYLGYFNLTPKCLVQNIGVKA